MRASEQLRPQPAHQGPPAPPSDPYFHRLREAIYRSFAAHCRTLGMRRVLDAGCGDGFGSAVLAAAGLDVVGTDHDVTEAARTYRFGSIAFRPSDPTGAGEAQRSYDAVVSVRGLERLPDPQALLVETRRVLRPGGALLMATANRLRTSPGRTRPIDGSLAWEYTPDELCKAVCWRFPQPRMVGVFQGRRLRAIEKVMGASLPVVLRRVAPADRAAWLRAALRRVRPADFRVGPGVLREAVDLVAIARV